MSSLFRRLRNYRSDTTVRLSELTSGGKNAPPTFVPDLIQEETCDRDDEDHLALIAAGDPLGNYICNKLSENAFDDWFKFTDADGNEVMEDVQAELVRLQAKKVLTQTLQYERTFGYAYLYTGKNRYVPQTPEGSRLAALHPFSPQECVVKTYDQYGVPSQMELTVNVGQGEYTTVEQKIQLPAEDFIFWNTRPIGRGYKGRSALYSVWDYLTYLRYIYHSMCWYDMKIANGILCILTKSGIPDELRSKINIAAEDYGVKKVLVLDGTKVEPPAFIGPSAGQTDFEVHIDACLKLVAAGTGIPKDVLIGLSAGSITGSEINVKALFATLNQIQTSVEIYIRDLVRRMGYPDEDYLIAWNARFAHDEEEQSKIRMNDAQALAIRSAWLTVNELREADGLPPRADGDKLKMDFEIGIQAQQMKNSEQQDNTKNPEGKQV